MIRVVVHTDEPLLARAIRELLGGESDLGLVAVAGDETALALQLTAEHPDIALVSSPAAFNGALLASLHRQCPHTAVVLWVSDIAPEVAHRAVELGARGILRRTLAPEMILKCLRKVHAGEMWLEKALSNTFLRGRLVRLSHRESQMVALLAEGQKNKEIAAALSISEGTVKVYLSRLFAKVGAKDRYELALFGLRSTHNAGANPAAAGLRSLFIPTGEAALKRPLPEFAPPHARIAS